MLVAEAGEFEDLSPPAKPEGIPTGLSRNFQVITGIPEFYLKPEIIEWQTILLKRGYRSVFRDNHAGLDLSPCMFSGVLRVHVACQQAPA